jgi:hypothetical protein
MSDEIDVGLYDEAEELPMVVVEEAQDEPVLVDVRIVRVQGESALVGYMQDGKVRQVVIPFSAIVDGQALSSVLASGIRHGLPWSDMVSPAATPEAVEQALYRADIWTGADLRSNPRAALGALQAVYGVDLAALLRAAREFEQ